MKHLLLLASLLLIWSNLHAFNEGQGTSLKFESAEVQVSNFVNLNLWIKATDSVYISDSLNWQLPEGFSVLSRTHFQNGNFLPNDSLSISIQIGLPQGTPSFYPYCITFIQGEDSINPGLSRKAWIYFTPYATIEIWDEIDFNHAGRNWFLDTEKPRIRRTINPSSIPISNVIIPSVDIEGWEANHEEVFIEGLPYSIPMIPQNPDSVQDTSNIVFGENSRADGCGPGYKRFQGQVFGTVKSTFRRDAERSLFVNWPLSGLKVELWEKDLFPIPSVKLGEGITDSEGNFTISFNTCQLGEGNEIELFVRVFAENPLYDIKGKNILVGGFVAKGNSGIELSPYQSGDPDSISFGNIYIQSAAHRAVHLLGNAYEYCNQYSGVTLENGLTVRAAFKNWGSFFVPDTYSGVRVTTMPGIYAQLQRIFNGQGVGINVWAFWQSITEPQIVIHESGDAENTPYHEFGHFLMWQLQNKKWTDLWTGSFAVHSIGSRSNPRIAWTEGWASGFAAILDGHFRDWDLESGFSRFVDYENNQSSNLFERGFELELFIGRALLDIWDGPDKYAHLSRATIPNYRDTGDPNDPQEGAWQVGVFDDLSFSFQEMCDAIRAGESGAPNGQIQSIQGFYNYFRDTRSCDDLQLIKTVLDQNRIMGEIYLFPNGEYQGLSTDEIYDVRTYNRTLEPENYGFDFDWERDVRELAGPGQSFNLIRDALNPTNSISDDLVIRNGANLYLNGNQPRGWVVENDPQRPVNGLKLFAEICGGRTVEVKEFGKMEVGDFNGNHPAELRVTSGSTLIIGGPNSLELGTLKIHKGSKVIVEPGATLIVDEFAKLDLPDPNSVLEIRGNLHLRDDAKFTFDGAGHIVLVQDGISGAITAGNNASIELEGNNSSDLILLIVDQTALLPPSNLEKLSLKTGKVILGQDAFISTADADIHLEDLQVTSLHTGQPHRGIFVNGQANHILKNLLISQGNTGITGFQFYNDGALLKITNSTFLNCGTGIKVFDKGLQMENCSVSQCGTGVEINGASFYSLFRNSSLIANTIGVDFRTTIAGLHLDECAIDQNGDGVFFTGPGILSADCGSISHNTGFGISVGMNAILELNSIRNSAGSQVKILGNGTSIGINQAANLDLLEGKNDLVPMIEGNGNVVTGIFLRNCGISQTPEMENHWNTRTGNVKGAPPVFSTDYVTYNFQPGSPGCLTPTYLSDPDRANPGGFCLTGAPGGGSGSSSARTSPYYNCPGCSRINTPHFSNKKLNEALQTAFDFAEWKNVGGDDSVAISLLEEILESPVNIPNPDEKYLLNLTYSGLMATYSHAGAVGQVSPHPGNHFPVSNPSVARAQQAASGKINAGGNITDAKAQQAAISRSIGFRQDAISRWDSLQGLVDAQHSSYLDYLKCLTLAEIEGVEGRLAPENVEDWLENCQGFNKAEDFLWISDLRLAELKANGHYSDLQMENLVVFPNPASGKVHIWIRNGVDEQVKLRILDVMGRTVAEDKIVLVAGEGIYDTDVSSWKAGVYFVVVDFWNSRKTISLVVR